MVARKRLTKTCNSEIIVKESHIYQLSTVNMENVKNTDIEAGNTTSRKHLTTIIKKEFDYISNLFDILDIANLNNGRIHAREEDCEDENLQILNIPEKKSFKKHGSGKGTPQPSSKDKAFPQSIDGLEKELEELKGTPLTYQNRLRKKGLHSRLVKKKRKEELKQRKGVLKQAKICNTAINRPSKLMKPVFNSDGNIVSNKFDFADSETKKEGKRKLVVAHTEVENNNEVKKKNMSNVFTDYIIKDLEHINSVTKQTDRVKTSLSDDFKNKDSKDYIQKEIGDVFKPKFKKENVDLEKGVNNQKYGKKLAQRQGPVFNRDNKMVFSKVFIPENNKKPKKKLDRNPKVILQKIKDMSKNISELEKENREEAVSLKEKQKWAAALKRASGEKVKDDPELLRKSISKEKNKKMRSQKKWQARMDHVQKEKEEKQKKRTENIQGRKNEKKKRKMKKAINKGSFVQV